MGRRKFRRHQRASYLDGAIFFLLLLISLIFGHLGPNHVPHQACIPLLAIGNRGHVALLRVVKECFRRLLHIRSQTRVEALLSEGPLRAVDERLHAHALVNVLNSAVSHVCRRVVFVLCLSCRCIPGCCLHGHLWAGMFINYDNFCKFCRVL